MSTIDLKKKTCNKAVSNEKKREENKNRKPEEL